MTTMRTTRKPHIHGARCCRCGEASDLHEVLNGDWVRAACAECGAVTVRLTPEGVVAARARTDKFMIAKGLCKSDKQVTYGPKGEGQ